MAKNTDEMTYEEVQEAQSADEGSAWIAGRMLRLPLNESATDVRILILEGGYCRDDFVYHADDHGGWYEDFNPIMSLKGERIAEMGAQGIRKNNPAWLPGRRVRFNTMTREIIRD